MTQKLVVITGASSGIGYSTAHKFAEAGFSLVLVARRKERLEQLQNELCMKPIIYELDVTDAEEVNHTIESIESRIGAIDILVNNAGVALGLEPAHACSIQEWNQCVDVNIKGLLYCTHATLAHMVRRNKGHIINIGSIAGTYPYPGGNVYGATKAFVRQFSLNLRADLLGTKVRVSCIEPGMTEGTEFSLVRFRGDAERAARVYENTVSLQPQDVAEAVYMCTCMPEHVNINMIELMPVMQASGALAVYRGVV